MLESQQTYTDPRANKSTDFQPSTNNPQNISNQNIQQQGGNIQGLNGSQEALGQQQNATIQVPKVTPKSAQNQAVTTAAPDYLLFAIFGVIVTVIIVATFIKKNLNNKDQITESAIGSPVAKFEKIKSEPKVNRTSVAPSKPKKASANKSKKTVNKQKRGKKKK